MSIKKIILSVGMLGALGMISSPLLASEANEHQGKGHGALLLEITPEDVKGLQIKRIDEGDVEMKGFSVARKNIRPGMARVALNKLKSHLKPGEEVMLGIGVVTDGKAQACKLKLTMGHHHKFSQARVEECDVFKNADIHQKGKRVFIVLKKM